MESTSIMHFKGGGSQPPSQTKRKRQFPGGLPFNPQRVRVRGITDRRSRPRAEEIAHDLYVRGIWDGNCNIFIRNASQVFDTLYIQRTMNAAQLTVRTRSGVLEVAMPERLPSIQINLQIAEASGITFFHFDVSSLDAAGKQIAMLDESTAISAESFAQQLLSVIGASSCVNS